MVHAGSFKVPVMVPQDLAIIMEFIDPPQSEVQIPVKPDATHGNDGLPNLSQTAASALEDDIESSGAESESEVEAEIALQDSPGPALDNIVGPDDSKDSDFKDSESESESSSISGNSPDSSLSRLKYEEINEPVIVDIDLEDGPLPVAYVPSVHELPPAAIPIPPLPDPSTLPPDPLEYVGQIVSVLQDTIIVQGSRTSGRGHMTPQERRDAALDEGSLLLFEDRTMLGHVWETFGPTSLPHYIVRVNNAGRKPSLAPTPHEGSTDAQTTSEGPGMRSIVSEPPHSSFLNYEPDPTKFKTSTSVYHIPSLSRFVFSAALEKLKGSDASNVHDEEPAEHELEFSDDEAEAAHKRPRHRSSSYPLSSVLPEDDTMSAIGDDACSLYGASPYDFDGVSAKSASVVGNAVDPPAKFGDPAIHNALMLARSSRSRRPSFTSFAEKSHIAGPSHLSEDRSSVHGRSRGRGRGRGADRPRTERMRDRNARGRGRVQVPTTTTLPHQLQAPRFSFQEYDPHMPRPPSPTSLAIARATGQWLDGTPFPYEFNQPPYGSGPYGLMPLDLTSPYPIAPHINPRFAHAFGLPAPASPASGFNFPSLEESSDARTGLPDPTVDK